jgi:hypothetical protein
LPYLEAAVEFAQQAAVSCSADGEHDFAREAEELMVSLKAFTQTAQKLHQKALQHPAAPSAAASVTSSPPTSPVPYKIMEVEYNGPRATPDWSISVKLRASIPAVLPAVSNACAEGGDIAGVDGIPTRYHWCQLHTDLSALVAASDDILCRDVRLLLRPQFRRPDAASARAVLEASVELVALFRHCA